MAQIKAGSKVRARMDASRISGEKLVKGQEYTVDHIEGGDEVYLVGMGNYFAMHRFDLIEEANGGLRIGDAVEVVETGWGISSVDKGKRAMVVAIKTSDIIVIDGSSFSYHGYGDKARITCRAISVQKVASLDFSKPLFTTEGTPVELLTTTGRDPKFPVLAYEGKATSPSKFTVDGISSLGIARRNLTNTAPKIEQTRFHNVYKNSEGVLYLGDAHATVDQAKQYTQKGAVGLAKIVLVEGQFAA